MALTTAKRLHALMLMLASVHMIIYRTYRMSKPRVERMSPPMLRNSMNIDQLGDSREISYKETCSIEDNSFFHFPHSLGYIYPVSILVCNYGSELIQSSQFWSCVQLADLIQLQRISGSEVMPWFFLKIQGRYSRFCRHQHFSHIGTHPQQRATTVPTQLLLTSTVTPPSICLHMPCLARLTLTAPARLPTLRIIMTRSPEDPRLP